jgi:glycosyltransferase involved in cell wall biosynthesis
MENNSLISVVIPCYNDAQYIEQAVQSVLNQTYSNIEVIIVDDGSNVATKAVLKKLEPKITKLFTQENQGQSKARNVGILQAKGDYILVLDSDDYFEPSFCEKALPVLEDINIKLVASYMVRFNDSGIVDEYRNFGGDISTLILNNQATGSVLFRKKDFIRSGGYDEMMRSGFEDWEFYIRMLQNGGNLFVIKEPLFYYRLRENSTTSRANKIKYELLKYIYLKHQVLYIAYFDNFVSHLLSKIEREEKEKIKNTQRLEFKIGITVLKPFRWIKRIFKLKSL